MIGSILLVAALAGLSYLLYFFIVRPLYFRHLMTKQGIPAAPFIPVLGDILPFLRLQDEVGAIEAVKVLHKRHGKMYVSTFGSDPALRVADPVYIKEIYGTKYEMYCKPERTKEALLPIGGLVNLFVSDGDVWKSHRAALNPGFDANHIMSMCEVMDTRTRGYVDKLRASIGDKPSIELDFFTAVNELTLENITACLFGLSERDGVITKQFSEYFNRAFHLVEEIVLSPFSLLPFYSKLPLPTMRKLKATSAKLHELVLSLIEKRRNKQSESICKGPDILDILLEAKQEDKGFTNQEILNESVTFLAAGHETTTNLLVWALYLLTTRADLYERVMGELSTAAKGKSLDYALVKELKVLDAFVSESQRLYTPSSFLGREVVADHHIGPKGKEIFMPKGLLVMIGMPAVHTDPLYWKDPETFNLDRFLDKDTHRIEPFTFMAFGGGPRVCIGRSFALMEVKIILTNLLLNFKFEFLPQKVQAIEQFTVKSKYGLMLRVSPL